MPSVVLLHILLTVQHGMTRTNLCLCTVSDDIVSDTACIFVDDVGDLYGKQPWMCRPLAEAIPKERAPGLPVFRQALACVPYILPEHWTSGKLVDDLPGMFHTPSLPHSCLFRTLRKACAVKCFLCLRCFLVYHEEGRSQVACAQGTSYN